MSCIAGGISAYHHTTLYDKRSGRLILCGSVQERFFKYLPVSHDSHARAVCRRMVYLLEKSKTTGRVFLRNRRQH
jgi:hypothetical protein